MVQGAKITGQGWPCACGAGGGVGAKENPAEAGFLSVVLVGHRLILEHNPGSPDLRFLGIAHLHREVDFIGALGPKPNFP